MKQYEVAVGGGGIIGLSVALALKQRGMDVVLIDEPRAGMASLAAAGMLAADDPENPPELHALSLHSVALYPEYLDHLEMLGGQRVVWETSATLQKHVHAPIADRVSAHRFTRSVPALSALEDFVLLQEHSLDPRKLHAAAQSAVDAAGVKRIAASVRATDELPHGITITLSNGDKIEVQRYVDCTGAWMRSVPQAVTPRKGQMMRVRLGDMLHTERFGNVVLRTPEIYVVPRLDGSAIIGATVEDIGFDLSTHEDALERVQQTAAELVPAIAHAPRIEQWAGLRPGTRDDLPLIGALTERHFVAGGHFRNGILLAPATAEAVADLIFGNAPQVDLSAFQPLRFGLGEPHPVFAQPS
ncbi:MAG: FAD-dependent oxidoreductase [Acidobacteria bacterium]|nr:FAD-dependent oxidoreductase [Acidobacteriota bacterium]